MTDPQLVPRLRAWLRSTDEAPEDVRRSATIVAARLEGERQRGRWWPLPSPRRSKAAREGRRSMSSLVQFMAASVIALTIGGAVFISQPVGQPSGLSGASADAGPAAPVAVTATGAAGACPGVATTETIAIVTRSVGGWCRPWWQWSDERLNGQATWAYNDDAYTDGSGLTIGMFAMSFENERGAWRMRPLPVLEFPDAPAVAAEVWILDGEGEYEGLTAVLLVEDYVPHGFIIDGELPPVPENASAK